MQNQGEEEKQRVALYLRVSTEEQAREAHRFGVPMQEEALKGLIQSKQSNMVLAGERYIYIDEGYSGTIPIDERPEFCRLKEDLINSPPNDRPFDVVAVYKIDRFARQLKILLDVIDLFEVYNIKFISANESIDTTTPFGKAMLGIIGVIAELERDTILQRTRDGRWQAFESGIVLGNNALYGYTKDENKKHKVFETEAEVVRDIFRSFVYENKSVDAIAKHLREHKVLSPAASAVVHGKRKGDVQKKNDDYFWTAGTVRRLLSEELYIGNIYGNKWKKGKIVPKEEQKLSAAKAPIIIDPLLFERAQILLSQSKHMRQTAKDGHIYLLGGLLKCDCCYDKKEDSDRNGWHGERRNLKNGKMQYYYKCGRKNRSKTSAVCAALPIRAEEIEDYIVAYSRNLLKNPVAVFEYQKRLKSSTKTIEHLQKKEVQLLGLIEAIPHRKDRFRKQNAAGLLGLEDLRKELKQLDDDLSRFTKERANVALQMSQHTLSKEYIETLDLFSTTHQRFIKGLEKDRVTVQNILKQLIEEIVVYTRPPKNGEPIAGKKTPQVQEVPYRIHIKLKLPQDIFQDLTAEPFVYSSESKDASKGSSGQKSSSGAR